MLTHTQIACSMRCQNSQAFGARNYHPQVQRKLGTHVTAKILILDYIINPHTINMSG